MRSMLLSSVRPVFAPDTGTGTSLKDKAKAAGKANKNGNKAMGAPATDDRPKVSFVFYVPEGAEVGTYKAKDTLTIRAHVADFIRLSAVHDDPAVNDRIKAATDEQIEARLASVDISDIKDKPEDIYLRRMASIYDAPFAVPDTTANIPAGGYAVSQTSIPGSVGAMAAKYGAMVDPETDADATKGIEATKDADATSLILAADIERQFGSLKTEDGDDVISTWPVIGTRKQEKSKHNKAPYGYAVYKGEKDATGAELKPWNGPYDYYETKNYSGVGPDTIKGHFVGEFVSKTPGAAPHYENVLRLRALLSPNSAVRTGTPPEMLALSKDKVALEAMLKDESFEFNRRVKKYGDAIRLIQRKREVREHFDYTENGVQHYIEVDWLDADQIKAAEDDAKKAAIANAARRRSPLVLVSWTITREKNKETGETEVTRTPARSSAFSIGKLNNLEPRRHPVKASVANLLKVNRKGANAEGKDGADKANVPANMLPEIGTVGGFGDHAIVMANYLSTEGKYTALMAKAKTDGALASAIVRMDAGLSSIAADPAIGKIAEKYEQETAKAMADASEAKDKAAAEEKRKAQQALGDAEQNKAAKDKAA